MACLWGERGEGRRRSERNVSSETLTLGHLFVSFNMASHCCADLFSEHLLSTDCILCFVVLLGCKSNLAWLLPSRECLFVMVELDYLELDSRSPDV